MLVDIHTKVRLFIDGEIWDRVWLGFVLPYPGLLSRFCATEENNTRLIRQSIASE